MAEVVPIEEGQRAAREQTLRAHLDAHNANDIEAVLATFATPRVEVVPSGRVLVGAGEVRAYLAERHRSFPDATFELIAVHHADRSVVVEYWMMATHSGEFHGVEPSGRHFRVRMVSIFDFEGSRITCQRVYYDAGTIARQLA